MFCGLFRQRVTASRENLDPTTTSSQQKPRPATQCLHSLPWCSTCAWEEEGHLPAPQTREVGVNADEGSHHRHRLHL
ncbi:hypothetical protein E2C01_072762 [Portunus trituberculatus]|uniref:Uncharacterized protein n=1 Tax=Portunus trituberculatus TaxID=210409 RepID=A0A5B7I9S8_PORTR|nr:hypothetical protein [Portunus trituberculatus]